MIAIPPNSGQAKLNRMVDALVARVIVLSGQRFTDPELELVMRHLRSTIGSEPPHQIHQAFSELPQVERDAVLAGLTTGD